MPKKIIKSKSKSKITKSKLSKKPKYSYLIALIVILALGYGAFKAFGPKPVDINAVLNGVDMGRPAEVTVYQGFVNDKGTWVPPGTYAGNAGSSGVTIAGQFYPNGTIGTFKPPTVAEQQAAQSFTQAVYRAAGYSTKNPCGGDFYYYSTQSNLCKRLQEKRPTMYGPRTTCDRAQKMCNSRLIDGDGKSSHGPSTPKRYLEPLEANTQTCFVSLSSCEQQNSK